MPISWTPPRANSCSTAYSVCPRPRYAHVPLVLGPDGRRLAKRHGAVTLADRRALGERPEEVLAWMASSLGLNKIRGRPTPADLLARFDPARLQREPTVLVPEPVREQSSRWRGSGSRTILATLE